MKIRYMNGSNPLRDKFKDRSTHSIELSDAKYKEYTSSKYFTKTGVKTAAELKAQDAEEVKENKRKAAKATRDTALQALTIELDGNVFQARPQDEVNFRLSIATIDGSEEWVLENNTVVKVSKADLEKVYALGLAESKAIYQTYKEDLKAL